MTARGLISQRWGDLISVDFEGLSIEHLDILRREALRGLSQDRPTTVRLVTVLAHYLRIPVLVTFRGAALS